MMTLEENCEKFGGVIEGDACMVDGFPMAASEPVFGFKPESQAHEVWTPDKFLRKTGWLGEWPWPTLDHPMSQYPNTRAPGYVKRTVDNLVEAINEKNPIDVPVIDKDVDTGFAREVRGSVTWAPGHEGRHRALACKLAPSCSHIPVVVVHKKKGYTVNRSVK